MKMELNFLFLTKFLVSVFLVCGVMFFVACGDDDDEGLVNGNGKTGEIAGVYEVEYTYKSSQYGEIPAKITITLHPNKSCTFVMDRGSNFSLVTENSTWTNNGNTIIMKKTGSPYILGEDAPLIFDGADTLTWMDYVLKRK
jgi:hypothetical protein